MEELQLIDVAILDSHPKNPRVVLRQDIIDAIASQLAESGYQQKYAIHVRPLDGRMQIISGHHRFEAAKKAGLNEVWCWVEEMDDDAAFMALVTSNAQGELDPLEIGIHAFEAVPEGKRGRGNKGDGLTAYAAKIGQKQPNVSNYRNAGEVVSKIISQDMNLSDFLGKAKHLNEIHKLPQEAWQTACEWLSKNLASVVDVKARVELAMQCTGVPGYESIYPIELLRLESFYFGRCKQRDADRISELIHEVSNRLTDVILNKQWFDWLKEYKTFDLKLIQEKRIELEGLQWDIDNPQVEEVKSELVSVLLADPPWQYDFAETDSRQIENQYPTATAEEIATHMQLRWAPKLADDCVLFMWATAPKLKEAFVVLEGWGFEYKTHAVWDKEKIGMGYWFRGQHELLLVATRGKKSPPPADSRFASVFREKRDSKHSRKPICVYEAIESMFPDDVKFEMYSRKPRSGWLAGGNDA
jgi:N6-adenosine-specific RNA methylase IME4